MSTPPKCLYLESSFHTHEINYERWPMKTKHDAHVRSMMSNWEVGKNDKENNRKEDTYSGVCMFLFSLETKQNLWIKS